METKTLSTIDAKSIISSLSRHSGLLAELIDVQLIWYPQWEHFSIAKANDTYVLIENSNTVLYSISYDTVIAELIERMHFHELKLKNQQL